MRVLLLGSGTNYFHFNTKDAATGAPITLDGTPVVSVSINGGAYATAGITLAVDQKSTGTHRVAYDVDDGTLAHVDSDHAELFITTGTVDGISVVGTKIYEAAVSDGTLAPGAANGAITDTPDVNVASADAASLNGAITDTPGVNVAKANAVTIAGTGVAGDPWRPA
jgi:hypothetical protein